MTDLALFREYEPHELGPDGYPIVWHRIPEQLLPDEYLPTEDLDGPVGVKDVVRAKARHRCERCGHPYKPGCGEWEGDPLEGGEDYVVALVDGPLQGNPPKQATLWSPCTADCTHGAPVRVRRGPAEPGPTSAATGWAYSWPAQDHDAGDVIADSNPDHGAGKFVDDGYTVQAAWRILTVHHLNGRKHDLRWWNLTALCQRCHLAIQRKVTMEQVYPFEHTEWFRPYAAGWYAYAYRGETLTRAETMGRLDELLSLERLA